MLVLAFMRPEVSFEALRVRTYRQLIDCVMVELLSNKRIPVLETILDEIKQNVGG